MTVKPNLSFFQYSILIILLLNIPIALAIPKTALVIGNSNYSFSPLRNPANDATEMAKSLRDSGFDVLEHTDLDRVGMRKAIRAFGVKLKKGGVGLFFFAGHGIQIKGKNYLIPIKSDITSADEVVDESIDANMVLRKMEAAGNDFNIVIMDACRNNPFARSFRSGEQGLARMEGPVGSIIAYATSPGSTAADGSGENGLYTSYLLKAMKEPGLAIEEVFKKVRNNVRAKTNGKQIPWESSSLTGTFQFTESGSLANANLLTPSPPPPPPHRILKASHLQVTANRPGGKVFVDNIEKGVIAGSLVLNVQHLTKQEVKVHIEQTGYKSSSQIVKLEPNEWRQAYFELIPDKISTMSADRSSSLPTKKKNINSTSNAIQLKEKPITSSKKLIPKKNTVLLTNTHNKSIESMDFSFGKKNSP